MNKREKYTTYGTFMIIYVLFLVYNYFQHSEWLYDNLISIGTLTLMVYLNKWLQLNKFGFMLFNIALLVHNLGTFGFYSWSYGVLAYDNVVHFVSSTVAAYIIFKIIARKLHVKKDKRLKKTVVDEHLFTLIVIVIATVAFLGVLIELLEFAGFVFLGPGEGILFVGAGDSVNIADISLQYIDTMTDIIVNTLGSITGTLLFYFLKYRKQPWLKYR